MQRIQKTSSVDQPVAPRALDADRTARGMKIKSRLRAGYYGYQPVYTDDGY